MLGLPLLARLRSCLAAFRRNEGGNTLMLFGLSIIPVFGLAGAASDYSRAATARTEMQTAVDSTALMVAKEAQGLTAAQVTSKANTYFSGLYKRSDVSGLTIAASYTVSQGSTVTVTTSGSMQTYFMGILGQNTMTIHTSGTATWGSTRLRVALVLDNTGSMADSGKIGALQTATHNLLSQLQAAASTSEDVYVSIVPFSKDVNVGSSNYNASWVDWSLWDAANGSCTNSAYTSQSTCTAHHATWNNTAYCSSSKYTTQTSCESHSKTWYPVACSNTTYTTQSTCTAGYDAWTHTSRSSWNGCITDRTQSYDTTATDPSALITATLFPAEQYSSCPGTLMGLSNNWTSLNAAVDAMFPNGNTNQTVGLQWGFQSLVASSPLTVPAKDSNYQYMQVVILLTDGQNTQNRWSTTQSTIDARTALACTNIKNAGITLYAIQVATDGWAQSSMLQSCASDSSKFFYMTDANAIVTTFDQIGTAISQLRISS